MRNGDEDRGAHAPHHKEAKWHQEPWLLWLGGLTVALVVVAMLGSCNGLQSRHWDALSNVAIALLTVALIAVARQQLIEYRRSLEIASRAWLLYQKVELRRELSASGARVLQLKIVNSGKSPATNVIGIIDYDGVNVDGPWPKADEGNVKRPVMMIGPGVEQFCVMQLTPVPGPLLGRQAAWDLMLEHNRIHFRITVTYYDGFRARETYACYVRDPEYGGVVTCDAHVGYAH